MIMCEAPAPRRGVLGTPIVTTRCCRYMALCLAVPALLAGLSGCVGDAPAEEPVGATLTVTSTAFVQDGGIPARYSCDGDDISPPISWAGAPEGTQSFVLICDDPDAVIGTWVHWVMFNIPGDVTGLPEDVPDDETLSNGALQGESSWSRIGYGGPCPPTGKHHYVFTVYALDTMLPLDAGASKTRVLNAAEGHIVAKGELIGIYPK